MRLPDAQNPFPSSVVGLELFLRPSLLLFYHTNENSLD